MSRSRGLLLAVAGACFVAGLSLGLATPRVVASMQGKSGLATFGDFEQRLIDRYDLSTEQSETLRAILLGCEDRRLRITARYDVERWPPEAQHELREANDHMDLRIEAMLSDEQRARYRADLATKTQ